MKTSNEDIANQLMQRIRARKAEAMRKLEKQKLRLQREKLVDKSEQYY